MSEETPLISKISTSFRHDIIKELLKSQCTNSKNKISEDTVDLIVEIAKAMVVEAAARACHQPNLENKCTVTLDHVECILPQMVKCLIFLESSGSEKMAVVININKNAVTF